MYSHHLRQLHHHNWALSHYLAQHKQLRRVIGLLLLVLISLLLLYYALSSWRSEPSAPEALPIPQNSYETWNVAKTL